MTGDPPQLALPLPHEPRYRRDDFIWAPSNEAARTFLDHGETWPQHRLALWGEAGSGKTHLLRLWAAKAGATLTHGRALAGLATDRFAPGPLAIDEADTCPEPTTLLHLLNCSAEAGEPVLLAARHPPARWTVALPDLASRLRATTSVRIERPDDALLRALLARLAADRQLILPQDLQNRMLLHLPRSAAALREAVARLDHLALAARQKPNRTLVARVIAEMDATSEEFVVRRENADCAVDPS